MFVSSYSPAWNVEEVAASWDGYAEPLVRQIAANAIKSRQKLPVEELQEKLLHWHENPPQVDRRLRDLSTECRTLLAMMYIGKRAQWRVGTLLELVSCLHGQSAETLAVDGLKVIEELFLQGMVVPVANPERKKLTSFEEWLGQSLPQNYRVWVAPELLARAAGQYDVLPELHEESISETNHIHETDGLEWFLRLGVAWQQIHDSPAKLTQQGVFFKRDQDRLTEDSLLNQPISEQGQPLVQQGHLVISLGLALGLLRYQEPQIFSGKFPESWNQGWKPSLVHIIGTLGDLHQWSVTDGWCGIQSGTNPWPSSMLLMLTLLTRMQPQSWTTPAQLSDWLGRHHCYWSPREHVPDLRQPVESILFGIFAPLKLIQVSKTDEGEHAVRLSPVGRSILLEKAEPTIPEFTKTLLVQPNMEMMAYRQGLTPKLVCSLSKLATWKTLGAACMLTIDQHSVHRGLEGGSSFEELNAQLEQHTVHPAPGNVIEALRTWAAKRDRLAVYQGINLLEFLSKDDRDDALSRGHKGLPLADRYILVEQEEEIDYRHFRTLGSRDYMLPPTQCVLVAEDGVTLTVDPTRADLLLETELLRFTTASLVNDNRLYRISSETLNQARTQGLSFRFLSEWFTQRTGLPITAAARLLWPDRETAKLPTEMVMILRATDETQADGLWQWPETRVFLQDRLGPTVFQVAVPQLHQLKKKLAEIGLEMVGEHTLEIAASA